MCSIHGTGSAEKEHELDENYTWATILDGDKRIDRCFVFVSASGPGKWGGKIEKQLVCHVIVESTV